MPFALTIAEPEAMPAGSTKALPRPVAEDTPPAGRPLAATPLTIDEALPACSSSSSVIGSRCIEAGPASEPRRRRTKAKLEKSMAAPAPLAAALPAAEAAELVPAAFAMLSVAAEVLQREEGGSPYKWLTRF